MPRPPWPVLGLCYDCGEMEKVQPAGVDAFKKNACGLPLVRCGGTQAVVD